MAKILEVWLTISLLIASTSCYNITNDLLSLQLLYRISMHNNKNFVISPLGVWTIVNCIAESVSGDTYEVLSPIFNLPKATVELKTEYKKTVNHIWNLTNAGVTLVTDNYVFFNKRSPVHGDYLAALNKVFHVTMAKSFEFNNPETVSEVNGAIQGTQPLAGYKFSAFKAGDFKTSNKLTASITFFHGVWTTGFTKVKDEPFFNDQAEVIATIKMMHKTEHVPYASFSQEQFDVLELTFGDNRKFSMVIFLPHNGTHIDKVRDQTLNIDLKMTLNIIRSMAAEDPNYLVDVKLPRFKMATDVALIDYVSELGAGAMFTSAPENVSNIRHKALIHVTEHGTTKTRAQRNGPSIDFHCNRPFMFFVIDVAQTFVIMEGLFENPSA